MGGLLQSPTLILKPFSRSSMSIRSTKGTRESKPAKAFPSVYARTSVSLRRKLSHKPTHYPRFPNINRNLLFFPRTDPETFKETKRQQESRPASGLQRLEEYALSAGDSVPRFNDFIIAVFFPQSYRYGKASSQVMALCRRLTQEAQKRACAGGHACVSQAKIAKRGGLAMGTDYMSCKQVGCVWAEASAPRDRAGGG